MKNLNILKKFLILTLSLLLVTPVYARIPDEKTLDFYQKNGIYYYNPVGDAENTCASGSFSSTTLEGKDIIEMIWNFFIDQGFSDAQTAGILGNISVESSFILTASKNGNYWGLFQWGGGRLDNIKAAVAKADLSQYLDSSYWKISSNDQIPEADRLALLEVELNYAISETDYDWQNELKKSSTPEESAEIFLTLFERATNGDSAIEYYQPYLGTLYQATSKRRDAAVEFYKQYSGTPSDDSIQKNITSSSDSTTNCIPGSSAVTNEFASLVKGYAWPDWHDAPWHDRMPAYAEAVTTSIAEGRYVGGTVAGVSGIDCGGFVTILAQNSGLAPDYNDQKGNTTTQEAWVKSHNWTLLNASESTPVDTSLLQAGDIAFSSGHTFIYVGEIDGFNSVIASASYSTSGAGRAPMAGAEDLIFGNGVNVRWYRKP